MLRHFALASAKSARASTFRGLATSTRFTKTHEYVTYDDATNVGTVGISDFAQSKLGDVVYIELPEVGSVFKQGDSFGSVESVKAASDVYLPVGGKVTEKNAAVVDSPQLVNEAAMAGGWFVKIELTDKAQFSQLLDPKAYEAHCKAE